MCDYESMKHEHVQKLKSIPKNLLVGRYFSNSQVEVKDFKQPSILRGQTLRNNHPNCNGRSQKQRIPSFVPLAKPPVTWVLGEMKRSTIFANFLWLRHIVSKDIGTVETAGVFFVLVK